MASDQFFATFPPEFFGSTIDVGEAKLRIDGVERVADTFEHLHGAIVFCPQCIVQLRALEFCLAKRVLPTVVLSKVSRGRGEMARLPGSRIIHPEDVAENGNDFPGPEMQKVQFALPPALSY